MRRESSGTVLFFILASVAVFAFFAYSMIRTASGGPPTVAREIDEMGQANYRSYLALIKAAEQRLTIVGGCEKNQISHETPGGANPNPLAPADGSCHIFRPAGGQVEYRPEYLGSDITSAAGEEEEEEEAQEEEDEITVLSATLGSNCGGLLGNTTAQLAAACDGLGLCSVDVDNGTFNLGNLLPAILGFLGILLCHPALDVEYQCGNDAPRNASGAYNSTVLLSCQ